MLHVASSQLLRSWQNLVRLTLLRLLLAFRLLLGFFFLLVLGSRTCLGLAASGGSRKRAAGLALQRPERYCSLRVRGQGVVYLERLDVGSRFRLNGDDVINWGGRFVL